MGDSTVEYQESVSKSLVDRGIVNAATRNHYVSWAQISGMWLIGLIMSMVARIPMDSRGNPLQQILKYICIAIFLI